MSVAKSHLNIDMSRIKEMTAQLINRNFLIHIDLGSLQFWSSLYRDVCLQCLESSEVKRIHFIIARSLETKNLVLPGFSYDQVIGQHWAAAGRPEIAFPKLTLAVKFTKNKFDIKTAIKLSKLALKQYAFIPGSHRDAYVDQYETLCYLMADLYYVSAQFELSLLQFFDILKNVPASERIYTAKIQRRIGECFQKQFKQQESIHAFLAAKSILNTLSLESDNYIEEKFETSSALFWAYYFSRDTAKAKGVLNEMDQEFSHSTKNRVKA